MTSFKKILCVFTPSNVIDDASMIDFGSQNGPKIGPKSLPKRFQRASEGALDEDSDSKLQKMRAESVDSPPGRLNLEDFGAPGGSETGRGQTVVLTRRTTLGQTKGSADYFSHR